jgi:hypothetical protein
VCRGCQGQRLRREQVANPKLRRKNRLAAAWCTQP